MLPLPTSSPRDAKRRPLLLASVVLCALLVAAGRFAHASLLHSPTAVAIGHEIGAGCVAGLIGLLIVYPLDTAKTRLQTSSPGTYSGLSDVVLQMVKQSGLKSLYRGVLSPATGFGIIFGVTFATKHVVLSCLEGLQISPVVSLLVASAASGATSSVPRCVFERVKSVMQVAERSNGKARHASALHCAKAILDEEGIRGLFSGLPATLSREVPQNSIYFPCFMLAKAASSAFLPAAGQNFFGGAFAGTCMWLPPFYWVDVVKSRLETAKPGTYKGFFDCARRVYEREGAAFFQRGLSAALMRGVVLHGTVFFVHEAMCGS